MEGEGLIFAIWRLTTTAKFSPAPRPICSIGLATGLKTGKRGEAEEDGHKNWTLFIVDLSFPSYWKAWRLHLPNEGCVHPDQIQRAHPGYLSGKKKKRAQGYLSSCYLVLRSHGIHVRLHEKKSVSNQEILAMDNIRIPLPRPAQDPLWEHCPINGTISGLFWTAFLNPCMRKIFHSQWRGNSRSALRNSVKVTFITTHCD